MEVDSIFKPAGENVKVLIIHSTEDNAGQTASNLLEGKLNNAIEIRDCRVPDFESLARIIKNHDSFNVLLFIAHGDKNKHLPFLYADVNRDGDELTLKYHELAMVLKGHVDDKLCLFGVCYSGTKDLAESICNEAGALACIAPKPHEEIDIGDIGCGYGSLLNKMQEQKHYPFDIAMLHKVLIPELKKHTDRSLSVFPVSEKSLT